MTRINTDHKAISDFLNAPDGPAAKHLLKTAIRVESEAKRVAPVDTGRLRSSITHELGMDARGLYARVGSNVVYARRIELGFRGYDRLGRYYDQRPRPYLRSALAHVMRSGG